MNTNVCVRQVWVADSRWRRAHDLVNTQGNIESRAIARCGLALALVRGMQGLRGLGLGRGMWMSPAEIDAVAYRVRAEFLEMPGLRLTVPQAARLWGLDADDCQHVIDTLVRAAFLRRTAAGLVMRVEG